jgi:nicotinate-nucleotide pyrophosphorylase (carboxylating)
VKAEEKQQILEIVRVALDEDLRSQGDITSRALFTSQDLGAGDFILKERGKVAGLPVAAAVFQLLDREVKFRSLVSEGDLLEADTVLARVEGPLLSILEGERTALNFLQRLSGIATLTMEYVRRAGPYGVVIKDTRKTTPCLRILEKYAVRVGGGVNHRMGLFDAVLIKDNHIRAIGGITRAVHLVREEYGRDYSVEVEVSNLEELEEAIASGADVVMLDNMEVKEIRKAVEVAAGRVLLEVSGGVTLDRTEEIASTGVDFISVGALTHSARALDISLEIVRNIV